MRQRYIDIAKGIAIISIILGHLSSWKLKTIVFTYHVPLFFCISGYFIRSDEPLGSFIKKKARSLLVPYLITSLIIIVLAIFKELLVNGVSQVPSVALDWIYASLYGAGDNYTEPFYIKAIGAIWFLWATFFGSVFLRLILGASTRVNQMLKRDISSAQNLTQQSELSAEKSVKPNILVSIMLVLALFVLGHLSAKHIWLPLSVQAGCCGAFYMYVGYLVREYKDAIIGVPLWSKLLASAGAFAVWIYFMMNFKSFWLVHCDIGRGPLDVCASLCGCYCVVLISYAIDKLINPLALILSNLGRYSLLILCGHIIELDVLDSGMFRYEWDKYGLPSVDPFILDIIYKFIFAFAFAYVVVKIPMLCKLYGIKPVVINHKSRDLID